MGSHIQPCRAASPMLPFTWISIIPKSTVHWERICNIPFTNPMVYKSQCPVTGQLRHGGCSSSSTRPQGRNTSRTILCSMDKWLMDQQALSEAFSSYFSSWKECSVPIALLEWNGSAAAPQHITLCGHCGQHCLSWLGGSGWSHWLCCPSQSIGILKTFLHVTRNTKEQATAWAQGHLRQGVAPGTQLEPFCHRTRADFPGKGQSQCYRSHFKQRPV